MSTRSLPLHEKNTARVAAPIDQLFAYLDNPQTLATHMGESSMMMMGSRMLIDVDAGGGRAVGSQIRMDGRMMGIPLSLVEVVTERDVPKRKVWQTTGTPKLLVISHYRMGFELTPIGEASMMRVFIDYSLPATAPGSWMGRMFAGVYARWCTTQVADGAARHFGSTRLTHPT